MSSHIPRILLTLGDPAGIGPEICLAAARDEELVRRVELILVGASSAVERAGEASGLDPRLPSWDPEAAGSARAGARLLDTQGPTLPPYGTTSAEGGAHAAAALERAVGLVRSGRADALVTAPLDKAALGEAGIPHVGHTPYLAHLDGVEEAFMVFHGGGFSVVLLTGHIPLSRVPRVLTLDRCLRGIRSALDLLRPLLVAGEGREPTVAVAAVNPHAGEGGLLGEEEREVLAPVVLRLREEGIRISGPHPGDTVYRRARQGEFDLVAAPYHDQGLVALKSDDLGASVHFTAGLSFLRASVDHGTAYDIAGTGRADPGPLIRAIRGAADLCRRREATPS